MAIRPKQNIESQRHEEYEEKAILNRKDAKSAKKNHVELGNNEVIYRTSRRAVHAI
jgi:hypothetical protein